MKEITICFYAVDSDPGKEKQKNCRKNVLKEIRKAGLEWTTGGNGIQWRKRQLTYNNW